MVKLYYTPTSCGAASFIAAFSAGVSIESEQVSLQDHKTASGADYYAINPKGNVPGLVLDDGTLLNEGSAVLQYIADLNPGSVAPANGTKDRYLVQNALNYVASEVHTSIGSLFNPTLTEEQKTYFRNSAAKKLTFLETNLVANNNFLVGDKFSVADSYLYIVLSWTKYVGIDLTPYPKVKAYFERVASLKNVQDAHARIATNPATTF